MAPGDEETSDKTYAKTSDGTYDNERWKERGVMLRVFVYVFATHAFAGFVWLLFYVGQNAQK
ncbi:DUF6126 family protein [Streptomyces sp. NPDC051822]|uniref:DUF6126 family protein n=1 Tax=Streptomyces sp. NPDC051822 TaxID=3365675 RepID=UPI0037959D1A